jgi:hypothetical protein
VRPLIIVISRWENLGLTLWFPVFGGYEKNLTKIVLDLEIREILYSVSCKELESRSWLEQLRTRMVFFSFTGQAIKFEHHTVRSTIRRRMLHWLTKKWQLILRANNIALYTAYHTVRRIYAAKATRCPRICEKGVSML